MTRLDRSGLLLAVTLAAIAGYVDAVAFITIGNFFVSFMSGNATRMGVSVAQNVPSMAGYGAGLAALFVAGVAIGHSMEARTEARRMALVLGVEGSLLALAAALHADGDARLAAALMVLAMGASNAVFAPARDDGGPRFGVTYVTGALARAGERLAAAAGGRGSLGDVLPPLALWAAFVSGATGGATITLIVAPAAALAIPAGVALGLAAVIAWRG